MDSLSSAFLIVLISLVFLLRPTFSFKPIHTPSKSAVFVTGGYRGIGKAIGRHLIAKGYFVFVTVRTPQQVKELQKEDNHHAPVPILMDVTKEDQVKAAVQRVQEICQEKDLQLVAVVNNAGINPEGDVYQNAIADGTDQDTPDALCDPAVASRVFETNVVGTMRVTRAFLPLLSDEGRIVLLGSYFGSIAGKVGLRQAAYEASKFAVEGLSDTLRRALLRKNGDDKRNIQVSNIKPGNISTDMNAYGESGPQVVAKAVEHAIGARRPKSRYYPGKVQGYPVRLLCWIFEHLPNAITDKL